MTGSTLITQEHDITHERLSQQSEKSDKMVEISRERQKHKTTCVNATAQIQVHVYHTFPQNPSTADTGRPPWKRSSPNAWLMDLMEVLYWLKTPQGQHDNKKKCHIHWYYPLQA